MIKARHDDVNIVLSKSVHRLERRPLTQQVHPFAETSPPTTPGTSASTEGDEGGIRRRGHPPENLSTTGIYPQEIDVMDASKSLQRIGDL
jgi:hypothetical protein